VVGDARVLTHYIAVFFALFHLFWVRQPNAASFFFNLLDLLQKSFSSIDGTGRMPIPQELFGVADLGYERLNMPVIEISIHKASGFLTYFFHTLIKQRQLFFLVGWAEEPVLIIFARGLFSKPYVKLHSPRSNNQNIQRNKAS